VTETTQAGRSDRASPPLSSILMTPGGVFLAIVCVVVVLVVAMGSFIYARVANETELKSANLKIVQLQGEIQKLTANFTGNVAMIADLQSQVKEAQAKLAAIMPTENTFNINPNQSLIVGDGHLTIGLIGSPTNDNVNININGKAQAAPAGAIINVVLSPEMTCQVGVQSFDMFRAVLTATCASIKPK
jgi:cell division protein FtsB